MKYFIVVFACCFVGAFAEITEEQKATLKNYKEACIGETGVDASVVEDVKDGKQVEFEEKLNCFSACMLKKVGIMKDDGSIDEEVVRTEIPEDLPQEKVDQVINLCKLQVANDTCESGGKVLDCLMENHAVSVLY